VSCGGCTQNCLDRNPEILTVKAAGLDVSLTGNDQRHAELLIIDALRTSRPRQAKATQALMDGELVDDGPRSHTYEVMRPSISESSTKQTLMD